jgi:hypothetical protein
MAHQHGGAILQRQRALGAGHVVGQRRQRVRYRGEVHPGRLQAGHDVGPARAVGIGAVHQHDVVDGGRSEGGGAGGGQRGGQQEGGAAFYGVSLVSRQWAQYRSPALTPT